MTNAQEGFCIMLMITIVIIIYPIEIVEYCINPTIDWFPIGSKMNVHYSKKHQNAYCGALTSMFLFQ